MRKKTYVLFPMLLICFLLLGGCGRVERTAEITGITESISTAQEEAQTEEPAEEGQGAEDRIFEYEIRELPTRRDENQIYGVVYIPLDAGEQMPAVIYAHGYGVTHQNGIQYAEKLAAHGYVVYCFDFCGGGNGSQIWLDGGRPYLF